MNKMITAVYDNETFAYEAMNSLKDLHRNGDITLYSSAVIAKNLKDEIVVRRAEDEELIGTVLGMVTGSTIGFLAGPAGAAAGALMGSLSGFIFDLSKLDTDRYFTHDVSAKLALGKVAVIADIEEEWVIPVDTELSKNGGVIFRMFRSDVQEDQLTKEAEALQNELQELKERWKMSSGEAKDKIATDIIAIKQKIKNLHDRANKNLQDAQEKMHKKVDNVKLQIKNSVDEKKEKVEKRFSQIKANLEARQQKLKSAASLTAEALSI